MQAARYQILIMYYIAVCTFGTILMQLYLALQVCFDSRTILRTDLLRKREKKSTFISMIGSSCQSLCGILNFKRHSSFRHSSGSVRMSGSGESTYLAPQGTLKVSTSSDQVPNGGGVVLSVDKLSHGFATGVVEEGGEVASLPSPHDTTFRVLFEDVSFEIHQGGTALVSGPSGVGKSTLLRILAGLTEAESGKISLNGTPQSSFPSMPVWRKQVRYVPQTKVDIPGSPNDLIARITSFRAWTTDIGGSTLTFRKLKSATGDLIKGWGMNTSLLNSEWNALSGGESQRMLVAISLASLATPAGGILLLDESTSALDVESKLKVEKSVKDYCAAFGVVAIWITHDPGQQDRMILNNS
jgi:ABC-type iron transport system FetAB ATPase subunit